MWICNLLFQEGGRPHGLNSQWVAFSWLSWGKTVASKSSLYACIWVEFNFRAHLPSVTPRPRPYRCPGDKKWTRSSLRSLVDGSSFLGETMTIQRAKFYNHGKCQTHSGVKRMCSDSVSRMTSQRKVCPASGGLRRWWGGRRFEGVFLPPSTVTQDSEQVLSLLLLLIIISAMWLLTARLFYEQTVVDVMQLIYHS